jgi:hypothetical protein
VAADLAAKKLSTDGFERTADPDYLRLSSSSSSSQNFSLRSRGVSCYFKGKRENEKRERTVICIA